MTRRKSVSRPASANMCLMRMLSSSSSLRVVASHRDVLLIKSSGHFPGISDALRGEPCVEADEGPRIDPDLAQDWFEGRVVVCW